MSAVRIVELTARNITTIENLEKEIFKESGIRVFIRHDRKTRIKQEMRNRCCWSLNESLDLRNDDLRVSDVKRGLVHALLGATCTNYGSKEVLVKYEDITVISTKGVVSHTNSKISNVRWYEEN